MCGRRDVKTTARKVQYVWRQRGRTDVAGHLVYTRTPKTVEKGYEIVKIDEVFHFPPENRRAGLIADYVNTWLKLKQEGAGWPSDCTTPEQKAP